MEEHRNLITVNVSVHQDIMVQNVKMEPAGMVKVLILALIKCVMNCEHFLDGMLYMIISLLTVNAPHMRMYICT